MVRFGVYNCHRLHDPTGSVYDGCDVPCSLPRMGTRKREISESLRVRYTMDGAERISIGGWTFNTLSRNYGGLVLQRIHQDQVAKVSAALQWLSWAGGLIFITTAVQAVLRATDKRSAFSVLMGTTALLNICLNLYLIPRFSHIGAAMAMVISEVFLLIFGIGYISRNIIKLRETPFIFRTVLKATFLSGLMGVGLVYLKGSLSIWVLIPLAVVFYGGGMAILGEFRERLRFD